jgi:glucosamine-6-phosphate deaminase
MRVIGRPTSPAAFAAAAADVLERQLRGKPRSVLALPTGNTPLGLYAELARRAQAAALDVGEAAIFNLDEYVGLGRHHARSYAAFIDRHVARPWRLAPRQLRLLRGDAANLEHECHAYDAAIAARGGVDLSVLGLGVNGHVAFNEPFTDADQTTHVVQLSAQTRAVHAAQSADPWPVPVWGITMGLRTILESRAILLLIAGPGKEAAAAALSRGEIDERYPVTHLVRHPDVAVIELCEPAARP